MNAKEAVKKAMNYLIDLYQSEQIENVGLEEVRFNDERDVWEVTIGFSRPWDYPKSGPLSELYNSTPRRNYKVVVIDDQSGELKSIEIRRTSDE